jgi:hypothetical protein
MRALTIIGLKLIGLMTLFWMLVLLPQFFGSMLSGGGPRFGAGPPAAVVSIALSLAFAFLLLARTEWVADRLRVPAEPLQVSASPADLLRTGLIVFGVFAIVNALGEIAHIAYAAAWSADARRYDWYNWGRLVATAIRLSLGWIVIAQSRRMAEKAFPTG